MRVFGSIVDPQPLLMRASQSQTPERCGVGAQLVGNQQFGGEALLLEQLAHQPQCRPAVESALNQQDLAFVVDGPPEVHPLASNPDYHLVEVPASARPRTVTAEPSRDHRSEFQHPTPDGFIGDVKPPLGEELLDVPIAQGEAQIEPNRMLDDHRRKAVAAVGYFSHRGSLPMVSPPSYPVILTKPGRLRLRFVTTAAVAEYIGWSIQQVCCRLRSHPTLRCRSLAYREFVAGPYVVWSLAFLKLPTGS